MTNKTTALFAVGGLALTLGGLVVVKTYHNKNRDSAGKSKKQQDTFESHISEHDGRGLVELSPGTLWHVTATFRGNGPPWRRMIVYRPPQTSSLLLLSPTAVPEDVMSEIDKLGTVEVLIVPNSYHRTDAAVFKDRYPDAKVACPPGWVRKGVSEVVAVDMDSRELSLRYNDSVRVVRIGGLCDLNESEGDFEYAYEFRCADGTWAYAVTDTLFNFSQNGFMNWVFGSRGIVNQKDGSSTTPRVGRISKWFMHSKTDCANFYRTMAKREDVSMILMAHGNVQVGGTKQAFEAIAEDVCR
jgi:hypothetical protein